MKIIFLPTIDFQVRTCLVVLHWASGTLRFTFDDSPEQPRFEHPSRGTRWLWQDGHWVYHRGPLETRWKRRQGKLKLRAREIDETHRPRWISWKKIDETPGMLKVFAFVLFFLCLLIVCVFCWSTLFAVFRGVPLGFWSSIDRSCCKRCNPWMKNCGSDSPWSNVGRSLDDKLEGKGVLWKGSCKVYLLVYIIIVFICTYMYTVYIYICVYICTFFGGED